MRYNYRISWAVAALLAIIGPGTLLADWKEGDSLPDLARFELDGELPDLEGKVVYIDFWASWCPPCKASFPAMDRLQSRFGADGFQIVAVSVDQSARAMQRFLDSAKPSFVSVHDKKQSMVGEAGLRSLPTSYMVDASGVIRSVHVGWGGAATEAALADEIEKLLKERSAL